MKLFPYIKKRRVRHEAISVYKLYMEDEDAKREIKEVLPM